MAQTPRGDETRSPGDIRDGGSRRPETGPPKPDDPVVARRRQIARWAELGQRGGYLLYGLAVVLFAAAMVTDLPRGLVAAIVVAMVLGSLLLAPSIVVGYGVRAADRDDRERAANRRNPS